MDLDLDLFERDRERRRDRRDRRDRGRRRRHPHLFSWLLLAGGALLLGIAVLAIAASLGAWDALSGAYFAVTTTILPASTHDEWLALPGIVHVAVVLGTLFLVTGVLGEVFD